MARMRVFMVLVLALTGWLRLGGGMANSLSLLELFALLEELMGVRLNYVKLPPRESDQRVFVADIGKARRLLGWAPEVSKREGIHRMLEWVQNGG